MLVADVVNLDCLGHRQNGGLVLSGTDCDAARLLLLAPDLSNFSGNRSQELSLDILFVSALVYIFQIYDSFPNLWQLH